MRAAAAGLALVASVALAQGVIISGGAAPVSGKSISPATISTGALLIGTDAGTLTSATPAGADAIELTHGQCIALGEGAAGASAWMLVSGNHVSNGALEIARGCGSSTLYARVPDLQEGSIVSRYGFRAGVPGDERSVLSAWPSDGGQLYNTGTFAGMEYGSSLLSSGSVAITFAHAFTVAPRCTCTHVDTTNTNACTIHVKPATTGVTFAVASGGSDQIDWQCVGDR